MNEGLHYERLPRFVVRWKGNNSKKVLEFCKGAARIEGDSVFISDFDGDIIEAKKGMYIINKTGNFWTAAPRSLKFKYFTRPRKAKKSKRYSVDIHSLKIWANWLLKRNEKTWVKLL